MVKFIEVKLGKKDLLWLFLVIIVFAIVGVMAYSNYISGVPSTLGHTSDEINVNDGGTIKTLQQWVTEQGTASSGTISVKQYSNLVSCSSGSTCSSTTSCGAGERVVGGGCHFGAVNPKYKEGKPVDGNGDGTWDQFFCSEEGGTGVSGANVITGAYVVCAS